MQTQIQKWGNSLGIRIPKNLADKLHFQQGAFVNLEIADNHLIITTKISELDISVHRAIIANSLPTVITLIKAKADLNVQDNQKFASLYFARLLEYTPIVNELKAAGAELIAPSGKFYNYVAFAKEVLKNKGKVTAKLVEPQPEEDKILGFYKGMADFYKAILSEKK